MVRSWSGRHYIAFHCSSGCVQFSEFKKNAVSKDKSKESASAGKKDGHQKKFKALYCDLISYLTAV